MTTDVSKCIGRFIYQKVSETFIGSFGEKTILNQCVTIS